MRVVQSWLRKNGQPIFDSLAKPATVKNILKEPYFVKESVTDELVDVLLTPLLQAVNERYLLIFISPNNN